MEQTKDQWLPILHSNFFQLDESTQKWVYQSYRKVIYRDIFFLFRNHDLAEDVVHESFMKVIQKAPSMKNHKNIYGWILTVARNHAYDILKKNKKYRHVSDLRFVLDIEEPFLEPTPDEIVEDQIRDETLRKSIKELPQKYRQVLVMFYIEEKSYKEIALALEISEQALGQLLVRARKKLYHYFSKRWVDETL